MDESIEELRKICQGKDNYPQRKISIYFTKILLNTAITPNQVTVINLLIGLVGIFFLSLGECWNSLIGALFLQFFTIFDCVDGELARYKKIQSNYGQYLDEIAHYIVHPATFIGLSLGLFKTFGDVNMFILGYLAASSIYLRIIANVRPGQLQTLLKQKELSITITKVHSPKKWIHGLIKTLSFVTPIISNFGIITVLLFGSLADCIVNGLINFKHLILLFYATILPLAAISNIFISLNILRKNDAKNIKT